MDNRKAVCSWSGGKDSFLAFNRAIREGFNITHLITVFDETGEHSRSHAVSKEVMQAQAASLGVELVTPRSSWQTYEEVFVDQLGKLKALGTETVIFGDIDLQAHKDWEEKVCASISIEAYLPLWGEDRKKLVSEFFTEGCKSVVICVNEKFLPEEFCGRIFDEQFVGDLPDNIDVCGENGEFHTFVFDGGLFNNPVEYKIDEIYKHKPTFPSGETTGYFYAKLSL